MIHFVKSQKYRPCFIRWALKGELGMSRFLLPWLIYWLEVPNFESPKLFPHPEFHFEMCISSLEEQRSYRKLKSINPVRSVVARSEMANQKFWNTNWEAVPWAGPFSVQLQVKRCHLSACHFNSNIEKVCQFSFMRLLPRWASPRLRGILMFPQKRTRLVNSDLVGELNNSGVQ